MSSSYWADDTVVDGALALDGRWISPITRWWWQQRRLQPHNSRLTYFICTTFVNTIHCIYFTTTC